MAVPKKRTSKSRKRIRRNIWKGKAYRAAVKAFSLAESISTGRSKSFATAESISTGRPKGFTTTKSISTGRSKGFYYTAKEEPSGSSK
uniref:Large ribosomal subunit protein bL32c n=6 Tax=Podocarpaceae TaxID=3362 RepID=A0A6H0JRU5_9CONI|nr:ribosomal protein L32 [Podocarpus totara]YP_009057713.1 ribosomal protein L32 [Retrophyllum piresii]YP_009631277.1 ribosomal protein L32 [Podocarpus latifolius]YP_009827211.1 ribosomal protein L32 [Podocarpus neriifolius]YP_010355121.1 ribosomal protein L32 [Podocarpus macrophyllus]YP_010378709.1 ribosomal protein L32 [Podocarpus longifoliolatus]YP_010569592.1 ribosomal protein L32 [Podocarpus nubigenus]YP_010569838.1 ribosomal protein L32 [Podocarpus sellowii]QJF73023.1 ribosomal protei